MRLLTIIILFSLQNLRASAQLSEILFHSEGKMQRSNFQIIDSLNIGIKKPVSGIIFNKLDSKFVTDTSLLYTEIKAFITKENDSLEYYFLYNGTDSTITINKVLGVFSMIKVAQTKTGELSPIMFLPVPTCGGAPSPFSYFSVKKGKALIFSLNKKFNKGSFKTLAKVKMRTSKGIISTRPFETYIDGNSFYFNNSDRDDYFWRNKSKQFIINYRKEAFLEK